jgi:hypothetical protein
MLEIELEDQSGLYNEKYLKATLYKNGYEVEYGSGDTYPEAIADLRYKWNMHHRDVEPTRKPGSIHTARRALRQTYTIVLVDYSDFAFQGVQIMKSDPFKTKEEAYRGAKKLQKIFSLHDANDPEFNSGVTCVAYTDHNYLHLHIIKQKVVNK